MKYVKSKTGLILPALTGEMSTKREISVKNIEHWRSQLHLSDLAASAKSLYITLQDTHQAPISSKTRYIILDRLKPTLTYLCRTLQKFYKSNDILSKEQRALADLIYALQMEFLNGYKLIIDDCWSTYFFKRKLLLLSFRNAMYYATKMLSHFYEQHRSPQPGLWLELHTLYTLALKKNIATKKIPDTHEWHNTLQTIEDLYKYCLLFTLAQPHKLRRGDIQELFYALEKWAPLTKIEKASPNLQSVFVLHLEKDAPPQYSKLDPYAEQKPTYFFIVEKLIEHLKKLMSFKNTDSQKTITSLPFSESETQLPIEFVDNLIHSWSHLSERLHERHLEHGNVKVCLGISSTYWHLIQTTINQENLEEKLQETDVQEIDIHLLPEEGHTTEKNNNEPSYLCEITDQSFDGYCLKWQESHIPEKLQCGEIIAIYNEAAQGLNEWKIGTIRWLRNEEDDSVFLGVHILHNAGIAVSAHFPNTPIEQIIPTLLLPQNEETKEETTSFVLLTPSLPFKNNQSIELLHMGNHYEIVLNKGHTISANYQAFDIEFLSDPIPLPPPHVNTQQEKSTLNAAHTKRKAL